MGLLGEKEAYAWQAQDSRQHRGSGLPTGLREYMGYAKIQGEPKKLDIEISKTTVANILGQNGLPTAENC